MPRRTALIVPVPEAEPAVGDIRRAHDWSAARGVPAHVTILFPFADADDVDEGALAELFARFPAFDFSLESVERFDNGLVWLRPHPARLFSDLTAAVAQRWPEHPPYEGAHDEVIPHLTVSEDPIDIQVALPILCHATAVHLIEESESDGMWRRRLSFPLSAPRSGS